MVGISTYQNTVNARIAADFREWTRKEREGKPAAPPEDDR
jgi:hypothetical protein